MKISRFVMGIVAGVVVFALMAPNPGGGGYAEKKRGGADQQPKHMGEDGMLARFDADGDKRVSLEEWVGGWKKMVTAADTNKDGGATQEELRAFGHLAAATAFFKKLDANGDGKVSRDEFRGNDETFRKLDKNSDGAITKDELPKGPPDDSTRENFGAERFKQADTNGDGKVTRDEWKGPPPLFDHLDANKDGAITPEEHKGARDTLRGRHEAMLEQRFSEIDTNKDGKISPAEAEPWTKTTFPKLDTNGDGFLDPSDRPAAEGPRKGPPKEGRKGPKGRSKGQ